MPIFTLIAPSAPPVTFSLTGNLVMPKPTAAGSLTEVGVTGAYPVGLDNLTTTHQPGHVEQILAVTINDLARSSNALQAKVGIVPSTPTNGAILASNAAGSGVWQTSIGPLNNVTVLPDGGVQIDGACSHFSGIGAPSNALGLNGDFYWRQDSPGIASQLLYVKAAGVWVPSIGTGLDTAFISQLFGGQFRERLPVLASIGLPSTSQLTKQALTDALVMPGSISVLPEANGAMGAALQAAITAAPANSTLDLSIVPGAGPGIYRQAFTGPVNPGVTLMGKTVISIRGSNNISPSVVGAWTSLGGSNFRSPAAVGWPGVDPSDPGGANNIYLNDFDGGNMEMLFVDGVWYKHVPSASTLAAGQWKFVTDSATNTNGGLANGTAPVDAHVVIFGDPTGHLVECTDSRTRWFTTMAAGTVVDGIDFRHAPSGANQLPPINNDNFGGFVLQNCMTGWCHGEGPAFGAGNPEVVTQYNIIYNCGTAGISGSVASGIHRFNMIYGNAQDRFGHNHTWTAGGIKFGGGIGTIYEGNVVFANGGPGLWFDAQCIWSEAKLNVCWDNRQCVGIMHEVSAYGSIHDNVAFWTRNYPWIENPTAGVAYNLRWTWDPAIAYAINDVVIYAGGVWQAIATSTNVTPTRAHSTQWTHVQYDNNGQPAGIYLSTTRYVDCYRNTLLHTPLGYHVLWTASRGDAPPGGCTHLAVHDNVFCGRANVDANGGGVISTGTTGTNGDDVGSEWHDDVGVNIGLSRTGTTTTVMNVPATWVPVASSLIGQVLQYTSGPASGLFRTITANTTTTITTSAFSATPTAGGGDAFIVLSALWLDFTNGGWNNRYGWQGTVITSNAPDYTDNGFGRWYLGHMANYPANMAALITDPTESGPPTWHPQHAIQTSTTTSYLNEGERRGLVKMWGLDQ